MKKAMSVYKKWLADNRTTVIKYPYLDIKIVRKYEKLAEIYNISHVTRGIKKSTKSDYGFLVMYKKYGKKTAIYTNKTK
jgi:hypothetical protein